MRITVHNRGPDSAPIHILPQAWFRNVWSWSDDYRPPAYERGEPWRGDWRARRAGSLSRCRFEAPDRLASATTIRTSAKVFGAAGPAGYFKDGINDFIVGGHQEAINPAGRGTKVAGIYRRDVPAGGTVVVRVRLRLGREPPPDFAGFDAIVDAAPAGCRCFLCRLQAAIADADMRLVQRQAFAGMLWSKQFYYFDVAEWLDGDPRQPPPPRERNGGRNAAWRHLSAADIISMPDKWEYPWFAAWDLAFHCVSLSLIDPDFAKNQLLLLVPGLDDAPERRAAGV